MALSDLAVRKAKATGKDYTLTDIDGLSLAVSAQGGKSWHFRYYWLERQKRMSLGTYPEVGLREARALKDKARALLASGINPRTHRKQKRHATRLASENTFRAIYDKWIAFRGRDLKEGRQTTLTQIRRIFAKDVLPSLGKLSIYEIRRNELLEIVGRIERRKAHSVAEKVRTWFNQMFRYALVIVPGLESNPASDLDVVAEPQPPVRHNPFLRMDELPILLRTVRNYQGRLETQLGLRLLLLTGVRTGELRTATADQFHLDKGLWIIPPESVKQIIVELRRKRLSVDSIPPYIVPLSVQAMEIVRYMLTQRAPAQRYLFANQSDLTKRMSEKPWEAARGNASIAGISVRRISTPVSSPKMRRNDFWMRRAFADTAGTRLSNSLNGGGSIPRWRNGATSSRSRTVPRRNSRAARISGVTGETAMSEARTAISSRTLRAPCVSTSSTS